MLEKTPWYWEVHRKLYKKMLDELDNEIYDAVMKSPHGLEAKNLNRVIELQIEKELKIKSF